MMNSKDLELHQKLLKQARGKASSLEKQLQHANDTVYWLERTLEENSPQMSLTPVNKK